MEEKIEKQPFHRMPSERRRKLWSLAARAAVKCPDDKDLHTNLNESTSTRECDSLAKTQDSGVSVDLTSENIPFSTVQSPFSSFTQYRKSFDTEKLQKSDFKQISNYTTTIPTIKTNIRYSLPYVKNEPITQINLSVDSSIQRKIDRKYYKNQQKSNLLIPNLKKHSQLIPHFYQQPYYHHNQLQQHHGSADTSGLGSSLDWASIDVGQSQSQSFNQSQSHSHPVHPQQNYRYQQQYYPHLNSLSPPPHPQQNTKLPLSVSTKSFTSTPLSLSKNLENYLQTKNFSLDENYSHHLDTDYLKFNKPIKWLSEQKPIVTISAPCSPHQIHYESNKTYRHNKFDLRNQYLIEKRVTNPRLVGNLHQRNVHWAPVNNNNNNNNNNNHTYYHLASYEQLNRLQRKRKLDSFNKRSYTFEDYTDNNTDNHCIYYYDIKKYNQINNRINKSTTHLYTTPPPTDNFNNHEYDKYVKHFSNEYNSFLTTKNDYEQKWNLTNIPELKITPVQTKLYHKIDLHNNNLFNLDENENEINHEQIINESNLNKNKRKIQDLKWKIPHKSIKFSNYEQDQQHKYQYRRAISLDKSPHFEQYSYKLVKEKPTPCLKSNQSDKQQFYSKFHSNSLDYPTTYVSSKTRPLIHPDYIYSNSSRLQNSLDKSNERFSTDPDIHGDELTTTQPSDLISNDEINLPQTDHKSDLNIDYEPQCMKRTKMGKFISPKSHIFEDEIVPLETITPKHVRLDLSSPIPVISSPSTLISSYPISKTIQSKDNQINTIISHTNTSNVTNTNDLLKSQSVSQFPPASILKVSVNMSGLNELQEFAEYWDHSIFSNARITAVCLASVASVCLICSICANTWIYQGFSNNITYSGFWKRCDLINQTCELTLPFFTKHNGWQDGAFCILIIAILLGFLGLSLAVAGHLVYTLPKRLYYFHSGGEAHVVAAFVTALSVLVYHITIRLHLRTDDPIRFGEAYGITWFACFCHIITAILLLFDELVHELANLSTKYRCIRKCLKCSFKTYKLLNQKTHKLNQVNSNIWKSKS